MLRSSGLLIILALVSFLNGAAQFTKGTRMVGASVASIFFNAGTSDQAVTNIGNTTATVRGYSASIAPALGWFVSENTVVGFTLNINPFGEKVSFEESGSTFQSDKSTNFNVGLGGFARNYFGNSTSVLPFGQFGFDVGISNHKTEGFFYGGSQSTVYKRTYDGKSSGGFFANMILTGGITKMVGKYTGLEVYLGYNFSYNKNTMNTTTLRDDLIDGSIDETGKNETTTKYTNHRFILGIGFQVFLEKKGK